MPRRRRDRGLPRVSVLRLGHRPGRDPRLTTHLALAARAFGAERLYLHPPDEALARRIASVTREWGGSFRVLGVPDWRPTLRGTPRGVVHLTMYGEPLDAAVPRLRRRSELLVVVGGPKVPRDLFALADANVAVGPQPHSEVAALAVFLDRLRGLPGPETFPGARRVVVPDPKGKRVIGPALGASG